MPKRKQKSGRSELLSRYATISSCSMSVRLHATHDRGEDPYKESWPWLELRGVLKEPVGDVEDLQGHLHPTGRLDVGTATPAAIGSIIKARPKLTVVVDWPQEDFNRIWNMALTDHLKFAYLCFTKPHYGRALVVSIAFSSEDEEEA